MPRRIRLHPHLTEAQLHEQYRQAHDSVERSRWQFLWLLAWGLTATAIGRVTGYSTYWIGQIAHRYNRAGPDGVRDLRHHVLARHPVLSEEQRAALRAALAEPRPAGDHWCGQTVAAWMSAQLGRRVSRQAAWRAVRRLGARFLKPRPRHVRADPVAQAAFKAHLRSLLREVATAFPLFEAELAAFAQTVGASPRKQIVLVLDRAGWHSTQRLQVPDHVYLLFLPPYSPELQSAEHLWPLTNTVLVNRHFASIEELEDAQAARWCDAACARYWSQYDRTRGQMDEPG